MAGSQRPYRPRLNPFIGQNGRSGDPGEFDADVGFSRHGLPAMLRALNKRTGLPVARARRG